MPTQTVTLTVTFTVEGEYLPDDVAHHLVRDALVQIEEPAEDLGPIECQILAQSVVIR